MTHALFKESIWPAYKFVPLDTFHPAKHGALIEHSHKVHANNFPHLGRL